MCRRIVHQFSEGYGWYVPNCSYIHDIVPEWRRPGGGVCASDLTHDVNKAYDKAMSYAEDRVLAAQRHIRQLTAAKELFNKRED